MSYLNIFGPDGVGKSTICHEIAKDGIDNGKSVEIRWLRFNNYISKAFNGFSRIVKKSYYETYSWGKLGYHDYDGFYGRVYIFLVFLDHIIFLVSKGIFLFRNTEKIYIVDRYIFDIVVDLSVDTGNFKFVNKLFRPFIIFELSRGKFIGLKCNYEVVVNRRPDIKDDKVYFKKMYYYKFIRKLYKLPSIDTGHNSVEQIISQIKKYYNE